MKEQGEAVERMESHRIGHIVQYEITERQRFIRPPNPHRRSGHGDFEAIEMRRFAALIIQPFASMRDRDLSRVGIIRWRGVDWRVDRCRYLAPRTVAFELQEIHGSRDFK